MWQLLKNADIYTPEHIKETDILLVGNLIAAIGKNIDIPISIDISVIDLKGKKIVPGFIDSHVHFSGGGGEAGPSSRTPEIKFSQLTTAGITTAIGTLGTDAVSRSMEDLLTKARALDNEGITTFIYSGAYQADRTIFQTVREDIVLIDKIIGAGEIAISDHRSVQPQLHQLERLAAEARVGGMLAGKAGIIHFHVGRGQRGLELIWRIIRETEIPITQFVPTHINRTHLLLEEGIEYLKNGGYIDLTAGCDDFAKELQVPFVLENLYKRGCLNDHVTVSSDGNGSLPIYNEAGELIGMGIGSVSVLWRDIRSSIINNLLPLEVALRTITSNPATVLRLKQKGLLRVGFDADLVVLDENLDILHVWAKGKQVVENKEPKILGAFE